MSKNNYKPNERMDAYEAELDRLVVQCGPVRAFTDEENLQLNRELNDGMEEFLLAQRKRDVESALELKTIIINT